MMKRKVRLLNLRDGGNDKRLKPFNVEWKKAASEIIVDIIDDKENKNWLTFPPLTRNIHLIIIYKTTIAV